MCVLAAVSASHDADERAASTDSWRVRGAGKVLDPPGCSALKEDGWVRVEYMINRLVVQMKRGLKEKDTDLLMIPTSTL